MVDPAELQVWKTRKMPREGFLTLPPNSARNQKRVYERRIQIVKPKSLKGGATIDRYAAWSGKLERLGEMLGEENMSGIATIHDPLCDIAGGASHVRFSGCVDNPTDRSTVYAHSQLDKLWSSVRVRDP
jgi:hypothetical protein